MATRFPTISLDPPWPERGGGKIKRGADRHYPLLAVEKMPAVILASGVYLPAANAHMYMWATSNYLMRAGWLMSQIGFRYVACVPWIKDRAGLGQYFRGRAEFLLFGVRGKGFEVRTDARDIQGLIEAPRGRHSAKPVEAYELIERRSRGPYLELFARREVARDGWTHWGNEAQAGGAREAARASQVAGSECDRTGMTLTAQQRLD